MNQLEKINLRESRDFGETFGASIRFLRQNFKNFFAATLLIAGPFVLLSAIAGALYQANAITMFNPINMRGMNNPMELMTQQFGLWYFLFLGSAALAQMVLSGTVYAYLITYQEKGPGNFSVNDVASCFGRNLGKVFAAFLVLTILTIVVVGLIVLLVIGVMVAVPALGILLAFGVIIGLIIVAPPVMWQFSAIYLAVMQPDATFGSGFAQPGKIMRGNFWWTWLIVVCAVIAVALMGMVFTIPQAGYQMIVMFKGGGEAPTGFIIVATICTFMATMLYGLLHIIFSVHYYSLSENHDGKGMMDRINEIGNTRPTDVNQQY